jgi:hypothetical protein
MKQQRVHTRVRSQYLEYVARGRIAIEYAPDIFDDADGCGLLFAACVKTDVS